MDWFDAGDYEVARLVLQRGVAAVYLIAFVSAINQFPALVGEHGLLPAPRLLARTRFRELPSLFHWRYSDRMLLALAWFGVAVAAALVLGLPQLGPPWLPMLAFLLLWAAYLSIVNIGQTFYGFGWESLLLEAGFVVAFLGSNEVATAAADHHLPALAAVPPRARRRADQDPRRARMARLHGARSTTTRRSRCRTR